MLSWLLHGVLLVLKHFDVFLPVCKQFYIAITL